MDLLEEEMRRISQFLKWRSEWWEGQVGKRGLEDGPQAEGETAYALRQAEFQAGLRRAFEKKWRGLAALIASGRGRATAAEEESDDEDGEGGKNVEEGGPEENEDEKALEESEGEADEPVPAEASRPVVAPDEA